MSCYLRHLGELFDQIGLEVTSDNRQEIDDAIHRLIGASEGECAAAWGKLKREVLADEQKKAVFVEGLKSLVS